MAFIAKSALFVDGLQAFIIWWYEMNNSTLKWL
jgi:hypothetical protein